MSDTENALESDGDAASAAPDVDRRDGVDRNFVALASVLLVDLLVRCLYIARPLPIVDNLTLPDDAYLSLTVARNIARGLGPLYGTAYTNGFQPLYVFVMAPAYLVWPNDPFVPVKVALFVLALFDVATLVLLWKLVGRWTDGYVARFVACGLWALGSQVVTHTANGLETSMACAFFVAVLYALDRTRGRPLERTDAVVLGALCGLGVLARVDGVFLGAIVFVVLAIRARREGRTIADAVVVLGLFAAVSAAVVSPWLLYSHHYTGLLYPVSGRAVRFLALDHADMPEFAGRSWAASMLGYAVLAVFANSVSALAFVGLLAVVLCGVVALSPAARATVVERARVWAPRLANPGAFALAIVLAYGLYISGVWFFPRYMFPVSVFVVLVAAALADAVVRAASNGRFARGVGIAAVCCAVALSLADPRLWRLFTSTDTTSNGYMNVGLWAKATFPAGTRIGSSQSGALGYFAENLVVYNLDGVVNADCFASLVENRNLDYIRAQRIEYVVGWPDNLDLLARHSAGVRPTDLDYVGTVDGFRSWGIAWQLFRVRYPADDRSRAR